MSSPRQRRILATGNKYQTRIVLLAILPTLIICLFLNTLIALINSSFARQFDQWALLLTLAFSGLFVFSLIRVFIVSRNLVGPFARIIDELDEVIAGRSKKPLGARPDDDLANELLARINILLQKDRAQE